MYRYIRWQGLAINQLSIAVSLISGLSAAGIGLIKGARLNYIFAFEEMLMNKLSLAPFQGSLRIGF